MMNKLDGKINFQLALKKYPTEGNLVYEYNPFYNYRLDEDKVLYQNKFWTFDEFNETFPSIKFESGKFTNYPQDETPPIIYQKGQLTDFITNELNFDLKNPVNVTPLWSYDNSVNLILNDGKNPPRLINSRFSATERNKYQVCNRKGNNDTNIYDQGALFDIDTSLYKKMTSIPKLEFLGVLYGGSLGIGNYHFYFRYIDDDGNESDFFAESGLVSIFIGNTPDSIRSGFRNEDSHKLVKFFLSNTDVGYLKIVVYYSKATSDIFLNAVTSYFRIEHEYLINESGNTFITITGFEEATEVTEQEINPMYLIYGSVETQAVALNMLFLANVDRPKLPYEDLADCALRIVPTLDTSEEYTIQGADYPTSANNTYYDPNFIYNKVGYWDDEIYRFGVVFILNDNTLTPVFNIRGVEGLNTDITETSYTYLTEDYLEQFEKLSEGDKNTTRTFLEYNEENFLLVGSGFTDRYLENARGVVQIDCPNPKKIIGFKFHIPDKVKKYLQKVLKVKGCFFVRLKRIPTTLCQAFTIALDNESHTPVIPDVVENDLKNNQYITESFLSLDRSKEIKIDSKKGGILLLILNAASTFKKPKYLVHDIELRICKLDDSEVVHRAAICPEYDVNSPYLNSLFTGEEFAVRPLSFTTNLEHSDDYRHWYIDPKETFNTCTTKDSYKLTKIQGVEDNVKLVAIKDQMFSARAGEAEEAFRYEYIGRENKTTDATNLIRGSFGPYIGMLGFEEVGRLIDIKIPKYSPSYMSNYFLIRYDDKTPYYAVSDRFDFNRDFNRDNDTEITIYRGDCYICQFTHRLNRNFQDPSSPLNDKIVDETCWSKHYKVTDGVLKKEGFDKINLGDVNAILLGMWITLTVRSTTNLNIRNIDDSNVDETALMSHPRGFYPYYYMNTGGSYKTPEALCYNKGFEKSVSERWNFEVPDVPWIKNEFSNRIAYSNIQITDGFRNGFREFKGTAYRDYPKTYGSIIKLVEFGGNLLCVLEHGIYLIAVNERALAGEGAGGNVYVNTSNVLPENPDVISDTFGSQWRESVIKTPNGVYGVDTIGKKIWFIDNNKRFECISDFHVQEFLNYNISLSERELEPIIGVRNVKTHYNAFKGDVMFTFYDNVYGFEEKVWNLCWNERQGKWVTFYSWLPSYSENIYNLYFSFNRDVSKWIAKLGISKKGNDFSDGIVLKENVIKGSSFSTELSLANRNYTENATIEYSLEPDVWGNYEYFSISGNQLTFNGNINDFKVKLFKTKNDGTYERDEFGRKEWLPKKEDAKEGEQYRINEDKIVILLNIRASLTIRGEANNKEDAYTLSINQNIKLDAGYYDSTVALILEENLKYLTTNFWKHGRSGIIDIKEEIKPTNWYDKEHPFEFEFVVTESPLYHKIFDNLQIISNNAEPESFHYEITGDVYDFAKDKKNMYIRQEATRELYLNNKFDVTFDHDYTSLKEEHRHIKDIHGKDIDLFDKSTILPLYYSRRKGINVIEDYYHSKDEAGKDFSNLSGGEIVRNKTTNEYNVWNHTEAVDITKKGRLRGNMQYKENIWDVLINPLIHVDRNELEWDKESWLSKGNSDKVPIEINLSPIPNEILKYSSTLNIPETLKGRGITRWNNVKRSEVKIKDKYIKIRIRYSGKKLAIINAINTLYSISYS